MYRLDIKCYKNEYNKKPVLDEHQVYETSSKRSAYKIFDKVLSTISDVSYSDTFTTGKASHKLADYVGVLTKKGSEEVICELHARYEIELKRNGDKQC